MYKLIGRIGRSQRRDGHSGQLKVQKDNDVRGESRRLEIRLKGCALISDDRKESCDNLKNAFHVQVTLHFLKTYNFVFKNKMLKPFP